jgi:diguanylate cyclase (GGDEF)-like protein
MDLDGFKSVNDVRGHAAGDRALRRFGRLLRSIIRDVDFVGRYGGDEFLLVFSGIPLDIAEQRMTDLVRTWSTDGPGVGVSIGVAQVDERGSAIATAAADRALYRAKRAGGGGVLVAVEADYRSPTAEL